MFPNSQLVYHVPAGYTVGNVLTGSYVGGDNQVKRSPWGNVNGSRHRMITDGIISNPRVDLRWAHSGFSALNCVRLDWLFFFFFFQGRLFSMKFKLSPNVSSSKQHTLISHQYLVSMLAMVVLIRGPGPGPGRGPPPWSRASLVVVAVGQAGRYLLPACLSKVKPRAFFQVLFTKGRHTVTPESKHRICQTWSMP